MKLSLIMRSLMVAGVITSAPYAMASTNSFDARVTAMGGTGVAAGKFGSAPLVNPALLAKSPADGKFSLIAPSIGAHADDEGHLIDSFKDLKPAWNTLENAINNGSSASPQAGELKGIMSDLSGKDANASASMAFVLAVPDETLPVALSINSWGQGTARGLVSQGDLDYLEGISNGSITPVPGDMDKLTSRAEGMVALVTDYGVSLAHPFTVGDVPVAFGITPKIQRIEIWNYNVGINNYKSSDFKEGNWQRQTISGNLDTGFFADLQPNWTVALSAQNLFQNRMESQKVNGTRTAFVVRPQVTAGTSWKTGPITLSSDVDLSPISGFENVDKRQYIGAGAEMQAAEWLQVRAGYRVDMRGNDHRTFSAGVGLSPNDAVQFDLTAIAGRMRNIGGVAQLTFHF
jgi:hypothetical protein